MRSNSTIKILMADDDPDDRYFFEETLERLSFDYNFTTVDDGDQLIEYLTNGNAAIPDIIFLDINMPRKNGYECLREIKGDKNLKDIPVIIYSTAPEGTMTDQFYDMGANYYMRKDEFETMGRTLLLVLTMLQENKIQRPSREEFLINGLNVI